MTLTPRILRIGVTGIVLGLAPACFGEPSPEPPTPTVDSPANVAAALTTEDVVLHTATATVHPGWTVVSDGSAASNARLENPNAGAAKVGQASAAPASYFDMSFDATAGRPYHLWLRMRSAGNDYANDSVHVQFSDTVDASGQPTSRIGSTSSQVVVLEDCDGAGVRGWGWSDNGWCGPGASVTFATSGRHTVRVQQREDGTSIDQIVLSPTTYATRSPGGAKDDTIRLPAQGGVAGTIINPPSGSTLKVLTWNTSGPLGSKAIDLVVAQSPDVVFLQEVDSPGLVENLRKKLGASWDKEVITRGTDTTGSYVAIVSKFPLSGVLPLVLRKPGSYVIPCLSSTPLLFAGRAALGATITVGAKPISVIAARMTSENERGCVREEENLAVKTWASAKFPAPRIYGGDFNMQPESGEREYQVMLDAPRPTIDTWAFAVGRGTAVSFDGKPRVSTPTRNTRMDYVFLEQPAPTLAVRSAQILDEGSLSDHRMMITTFDVK